LMDEAYARQRTPSGPRPEYIPPKTYRRDAVIPGNPDLRKALEKGPMTRTELARHFQCSRSDVAKPIYSLIRSGEVIEEGDRISLLRRDLPSEAPECYPSTTTPQKIDSRPVSGPAMGMSGAGCLASFHDLDNACPTEAQLHEHQGCSGSETRPLEKESCANPDAPPSGVYPEDSHDLQLRRDEIKSNLDAQEEAHTQRLRDAVLLIINELPGLLEDREKLRKLREVLG